MFPMGRSGPAWNSRQIDEIRQVKDCVALVGSREE
jgi:hypothetical protein